MSNDAASDQYSSAEGYIQRAELLADLGRYDEAATEVGYAVALDPADAWALTVLARVHLAAERPAEALAAADAAVAAAPNRVDSLVIRGLALADLRRFRESAQIADQLLALAPDDAYAQRSAAAILAESRNGQQALNAAWRGVELAPEEPQAHLVLGLVSARLELFDLAERAYREALRLNPELAAARHDMGVIRLEQKRYAEALADLAEAAAMQPGRTDGVRTMGNALVRLVMFGAGYTLVAAVIVAFLATGNGAMSRIWAAFMALAGFLTVWVLAGKVPGSVRAILPGLLRSDRALALSVYAVVGAPFLLLVYTLVGSPWPLVLAIAATMVAEFAAFSRLHYGSGSRS
ncbi:MAG TPA: tetratricopeptide repeat protein [Micromonosporaceae bacterium]|nr:tetratricopeptide repeat protein [Micromonosporaceae bacterium]